MGWLYVSIAAILEVAGVIGLKKFSSNKTIQNALLFFGGFGGSFVFLYASFNYLQMSVAYAVWIGIGTAAAVIIKYGVFLMNQKAWGES